MDGEITIGTSLSTDKFDRQVAQLEKKMQKEENKKIKVQADLGSLEEEFQIAIKKTNELADAYQRLEQLQKAISSGKATPEQFAMAQDIKDTYGSMQQLETSFLRALNKQDAIELKTRATKEKYEEINQKVAEYKQKIESVNLQKQASDANKLKDTFNGVGKSIQGAVGKVTKLALGVFGIRSAYMALSRASSELASYDKQYAANLEYIRYALTQVIAPVLRWIVQLAGSLLGYINAILNGWFGINLFSRGSAENFNKMKASTGGISKAVKEIKKQLAGFDEINMLTNQSDTGTKSGAGGGIATPSFDLSNVNKGLGLIDKFKKKWKKLIKFLEDTNWQKMGKNVVKAITKWFTSIKWGEIVKNWAEGVGALVGALAGFISGAVQEIWKKIKAYFEPFIKEAKEAGGNIALGILLGIVNIYKRIGEWIDTNIFKPFIKGFKKAFGIASPSKVMEEMGKFIIEGLFNGLKGIWEKIKSVIETLVGNIKNALSGLVTWINEKFISPIKNFFSGLWSNIKTGVNNSLSDVKETLGKIVNWIKEHIINPIKDVFANMWDSLKKGASNTWENIKKVFSNVGSFFEGVYKTIKKILGKEIEVNIYASAGGGKGSKGYGGGGGTRAHGGIYYPSKLPKLASGGIINVPGRGVPYNGAIIGERGAEAVVPLTDNQQMELLGATIGKYITINANVINTMNGRVISRELKQIKNEQDFAFNQ